MFCLKVTYLTGRSVAARPEDGDAKGPPEWPPHPGRLFCALVAAWGETDKPTFGELALKAMEQMEDPEIICPEHSPRDRVTVYVPANDVEVADMESTRRKKENIGLLTPDDADRLREFMPETRLRNERFFTSASLSGPIVWFVWPNEAYPDELRSGLDHILRHTTCLGHSSSLVSVEIAEPPDLNTLPHGYHHLKPSDEGTTRLRVPKKGRLEYLQIQFAKFSDNATKTNRPAPGPSVLYAESRLSGGAAKTAAKQGFFKELVVLKRMAGDQIGLRSTHQLTTALRGAMMKYSDGGNGCPEFISGHAPGSTKEYPIRSERPHLAFVPLANVGFDHGDGRLLGVGVVLPDLSEIERGIAFRAIADVCDNQLQMAKAGVWTVEPTDVFETRQTLAPERWTAGTNGSKRWTSISPFLFDRFPKDLHGEEARNFVRQSCRNAGLEPPRFVLCTKVSHLRGVPPANAFPNFPSRPGKPARLRCHLVLEWEEPITGPINLGAGRYYGYGFCTPI